MVNFFVHYCMVVRRVSNAEYNRMIARSNDRDPITVEEWKSIPRNRIIVLEKTAFDVHSLKNYLDSVNANVNPVTRAKISKNDMAQINRLANLTGWKKNSWRKNTNVQRLTQREQRRMKLDSVRQQHAMIDRRLKTGGNARNGRVSAATMKRIGDIARILVTDPKRKYVYNLATKKVAIRLLKSSDSGCGRKVGSIEITWYGAGRNNRSKLPVVVLWAPRVYDDAIQEFQLVECVDRATLFSAAHNIQWRMDIPPGNAPGSTSSYETVSKLLVRALGFKLAGVRNASPVTSNSTSMGSWNNHFSANNVGLNDVLINIQWKLGQLPAGYNRSNSINEYIQFMIKRLRDASVDDEHMDITVSQIVLGNRWTGRIFLSLPTQEVNNLSTYLSRHGVPNLYTWSSMINVDIRGVFHLRHPTLLWRPQAISYNIHFNGHYFELSFE